MFIRRFIKVGKLPLGAIKLDALVLEVFLENDFFSLPAACHLFSRGLIFTRARVLLALLSLRKNGGLLVVYIECQVFRRGIPWL